MLQQVAINQTSRKKILTRKDLLAELERVLISFRERPQYASLRSLSVDTFIKTDNPFIRNITLSELATNPIEVLRDTSQVEKKEIAALVETFYLLNVHSEHSLNLMQDSFTSIKSSTEKIDSVLKELAVSVSALQRDKVVRADDSNIAQLRTALGELSKSENFSKISCAKIGEFWDPKASSCSHLANMTWKEMIETPPSSIFSLPNFGKSRFKNLLSSIEAAKTTATLVETESPSTKKPTRQGIIEEAKTAITEGINEIANIGSSSCLNLSRVLAQSNSNAMLTLFLAQNTIQRRVGQILGITESRVSQLLNEAHKNISEKLFSIDQTLAKSFKELLNSSACSVSSMKTLLGLSSCSASADTLVRMIAISLGAVNPNFKGRVIRSHWTNSNPDIFEKVTEALSQLPMSTKSLSERVSAVLPGCQPEEILAAIPPNAYFLRSKDCWYKDQEQALVAVLASTSKPLSAQEISKIFECGPRQMRYLLQNSKLICRIGLNNGRRYSTSEKTV